MLRKYPTQFTIDGNVYDYEKILKDDFFSVNVLYRHGDSRYVLKLSDFRFIFGLLLRPFACLMSSHEYKIYRMVEDIAGVPRLGPRHGWRGYFHEFVPGRTLHELFENGQQAELPEDFFDALRAIIEELHRRRIFYLDLNKRGNIILGDDGRPYLIDYQICMHFPERRGLPGRWSERLFRRLIQEDIYHLYKHKRKFQRHLMTDDEFRLARRSKLAKRYNRFLGKPYRTIKRKIYPSGSNEIIWYKWKKMKDRTRRMP